MERQSLSIRQFAERCNVSHTEIARKMSALNIQGTPQGRGKPTLLAPFEQDRIAQALFAPAPVEVPTESQQSHHQTQVITAGMAIYQPPALATRGSDAAIARARDAAQLSTSLQGFNANRGSFKQALLGMAAEDGAALGHQMFATQMSVAMQTFEHLQQQAGKQLGVVEGADAG